MAAIINEKDKQLQASSPRVLPVTLPPNVDLSGNVTGSVGGRPVDDLLLEVDTPDGDFTVDILQNSATAITVTSSNLFTYPGTGSAGLFVGSAGIVGKNPSGNITFSISALNGDAEFTGLVKAGSIITDTVQLSNGRTLADIDSDSQLPKGDFTVDILQNSATAITVTSSNLFTYPGTGSAGLFVGSAGIVGRNPSGDVTFSVSALTGDAEFTGLIKAGSVLVDSIQLQGSGRTLALIDAAATGYTSTQLASDLNAGVSSVLAGVGSDYRLNVDSTNAFVAFQHKDAVYQGVAAPGSVKPALGISASGIAMGYNHPTTGNWVNSVSISASGNAVFSGSISASTIQSSSTLSTGISIAGTSLTVQDFVDKTNEPAQASVESVLSNSGTSITMTSSNLFKTTTGVGGVIIGGGGLIGRNTAGQDTFVIDGATGAATFNGSIVGGSSINISGQARFRGNTTVGGVTAACHVNESYGSVNGFVARSNSGIAVQGLGESTNGDGVYGSASGTGGAGVTAIHLNGGTALSVIGEIKVNGQPGTPITNLYAERAATADTVTGSVSFATTAGTANSVSASNITGTIDADLLGGSTKSTFCRSSACNTGVSISSNSQLNTRTTGSLLTSGIRTRASGNDILIEDISDAVLKDKIADEVLGKEFIKKLRPRTFEYYSNPGKLVHGFLANEVANEDNTFTSWNANGPMGFSAQSLVGPLVNATNSHTDEIISLQEENLKLKLQINKLTEQVNNLCEKLLDQ